MLVKSYGVFVRRAERLGVWLGWLVSPLAGFSQLWLAGVVVGCRAGVLVEWRAG